MHILSNDSQLCNRWATKYPIFLSSCEDISLILNYGVTCQLNIQVKSIVQRYHVQEKDNSVMVLLNT